MLVHLQPEPKRRRLERSVQPKRDSIFSHFLPFHLHWAVLLLWKAFKSLSIGWKCWLLFLKDYIRPRNYSRWIKPSIIKPLEVRINFLKSGTPFDSRRQGLSVAHGTRLWCEEHFGGHEEEGPDGQSAYLQSAPRHGREMKLIPLCGEVSFFRPGPLGPHPCAQTFEKSFNTID